MTDAAGSDQRGPGIIKTIASLLTNTKTGMTLDEIVDELSRLFPDRNANAMRSTVKTQLNRQKANRCRDENRGVVFSAPSDETEA